MWNKWIAFCLLSSLANVKVSNTVMKVKGFIEMPTLLDEPCLLYLELMEAQSNDVLLFVFADDDLIYEEISAVNTYPKTIPIDLFEEEDEKKTINIEMNYKNLKKENIKIEFDFYSASYSELLILDAANGNAICRNPVKVTFSAEGTNIKCNPIYETIYSKGINNYSLSTRYFDFSLYEIFIDSPYETIFPSCEVRFYTDLMSEDFPYKNHYTSVHIDVERLKKNTFRLAYDFSFYINERNGSICVEKKPECDDEILPFFFPLSIGFDKRIIFDFIFYDVGRNKETLAIVNYCMLQGESIFNQYEYQELNDCIGDVEYEYV